MFKKHKRYRFQTRTLLICLVLLLSLLSLSIANSISFAAENPQGEARLRAAIVVGILRYTTWNNEVEEGSELLLCSVGQTYSTNALKTEENRITVHGRKLKVTVRKENADLGNCPVVIYGNTSNRPIKNEIAKSYDNQLTICDGCNTERSSAIVTLTRRGGRIGIEVNVSKAKKVGLKFSSDMLELATIVEEDSNG